MSTSLDVVNEWEDSDEKQQLVKTSLAQVLRWLNQTQLRYADKSEMLKARWTPTITSSGSIALPADFLREIPDRVQPVASATVLSPLRKVDYPDAVLTTFSGLTCYSIYNGLFYVWSPQACSPGITYNRKPATLTDLTTDLDIPSEYHREIVMGMEIYWQKKIDKVSLPEQMALWNQFDNTAKEQGFKEKQRTGGMMTIRGSWF